MRRRHFNRRLPAHRKAARGIELRCATDTLQRVFNRGRRMKDEASFLLRLHRARVVSAAQGVWVMQPVVGKSCLWFVFFFSEGALRCATFLDEGLGASHTASSSTADPTWVRANSFPSSSCPAQFLGRTNHSVSSPCDVVPVAPSGLEGKSTTLWDSRVITKSSAPSPCGRCRGQQR